MESVQFIQWCLDNLNYWTITLLMAIESSFIPFPSEVVVPPAAYKAAATGELNVWLVIFFATVGAIIGALATFTGRLVPAVRQLISIPAGLSKMGIAKFIAFTALGAGIWNAVLAALGWYLEAIVPEEQLISTVTEYSHEIGYVIIAVVALALGYIIYKGIKKK